MNEGAILLVEDNPDDELLALDALAANRVANQVVVARNGAEVLDYLFGTGSHAERDLRDIPALILLDLKMPKIGGLEVLNRIRTDHRTQLLPVVILTSSNTDEDRLKAYTLGANSYVLKPVDFDEFVETVGLLGSYWLILNQPPPGP
ncbi:MAG: response regulator [Gammaproteobacteria bacterium]